MLAPILLACSAPGLHAQEVPVHDTLTLTLMSGVTFGGQLWQVADQQLLRPNSSPAIIDRVTIGRSHTARMLLQATVTIWGRTSRRSLELAVFDYRSRQSCTGPDAWQPDSLDFNETICRQLNGRSHPSMIATAQLGYGRHWRARAVRFDVRASVGLGAVIGSFVETRADDLVLYERKDSGAPIVMGALIGGASAPIGRDWRLRIEVRHNVGWLPMVKGPAPANAPLLDVGRTFRQLPSLHAGVERVLNRGHRRRY